MYTKDPDTLELILKKEKSMCVYSVPGSNDQNGEIMFSKDHLIKDV